MTSKNLESGNEETMRFLSFDSRLEQEVSYQASIVHLTHTTINISVACICFYELGTLNTCITLSSLK